MPAALREALESIEQRISVACSRSGRHRADVTLVAVTKTHGADLVEVALRAGIRDIGENRVQEARTKIEAVGARARWHLIGHLQSNKAGEAARLFDVIQTVDSVALAGKLARAATEAGKTLDVLIQVNVSGENRKSGASPGEVETLIRAIDSLPQLRFLGLMTIPPYLPAEEVRPFFRRLREMRDRLAETWENGRELSMGMSDDFEVAIEEGSTMIRLGRALFGERG